MHNVLKKWYDQIFHDEESVILLLLIIAGMAFILALGNILTPVIAALILAFMLQGVVATLTRFRVPRMVAVFAASLLLLLILCGLLIVLLPIIWSQLANMVAELPSLLTLLQERLLLLPQLYPAIISDVQVREWIAILNREIGDVGQWALSFSLSKLPSLLNFMIYLVLVPILVFFFLKDKDQLLQWCSQLLPVKRRLLRRIWVEMNDQMANYVRGKVIEMFIVGGISYVAFTWLGLNYAALLATLVGISVVVPYIGAFLVTIPVLAVGFLQWGANSDFVWLFVVYSIIQALDGNVLVPLLFSEAVNLHPVAILLAVLIFGGIWGTWGVFFAIPIATLIKAVLNAWPSIDASSAPVETVAG